MNNQISVRMICSQAARIDSQNRKQLTSALEAEGNKRLESFMFEKLFLERLGAALRPGAHTTGWGFVPDGDSNEPRLWYKLLPDGIEGQLNVCDLAVGNYLKSRNCRVIVARYDWARREFQGNLWGASGQRDWAALDTIMKEVSGKSTPVTTPRDYRDSDRLQRHAIADAIGGSFTDRELTNLVASRLLINCHMYPWMGIQPMDIDACYVFNGRVRFIEFKRKYPQIQRLQFGLDERPHCALVDWLALDGSPLTHIILCDPIWNKTVSPLNLLVPNSASELPPIQWRGG